jgi:hypothetical protein
MTGARENISNLKLISSELLYVEEKSRIKKGKCVRKDVNNERKTKRRRDKFMKFNNMSRCRGKDKRHHAALSSGLKYVSL